MPQKIEKFCHALTAGGKSQETGAVIYQNVQT